MDEVMKAIGEELEALREQAELRREMVLDEYSAGMADAYTQSVEGITSAIARGRLKAKMWREAQRGLGSEARQQRHEPITQAKPPLPATTHDDG